MVGRKEERNKGKEGRREGGMGKGMRRHGTWSSVYPLLYDVACL